MRTYAGIELGGTKVVCGLATADGEICERVEIETTSPDETLAKIRKELEGFEARNTRYSGLGIGTFGPVQLAPTAEDFGCIGPTTKPSWQNCKLLCADLCDASIFSCRIDHVAAFSNR